ncbi:MAG: DUF2065 domain-containing protein [Candidatus Competibacteraceae bacterium]|nr:DUF2065 domain-containing protein [Candidatus Competibacteraceae bacterium]
MWDELLAAFALMLVLEGVLPFLNPSALRQSLLRMARLEDHLLRFMGLGSMALGLAMLYFVR